MTTPEAPAPTQQDLEHLQLLGIFHYVVAGLVFLFGCFPVFHLGMGLMMLLAPGTMFGDAPPDFPVRFFGLFLTLFPLAIMGTAFTLSAFLVRAGHRLRAHGSYVFCQVMAAIACVFFPFGTVLGVFTLIVLTRPAVKALFGVETRG